MKATQEHEEKEARAKMTIFCHVWSCEGLVAKPLIYCWWVVRPEIWNQPRQLKCRARIAHLIYSKHACSMDWCVHVPWTDACMSCCLQEDVPPLPKSKVPRTVFTKQYWDLPQQWKKILLRPCMRGSAFMTMHVLNPCTCTYTFSSASMHENNFKFIILLCRYMALWATEAMMEGPLLWCTHGFALICACPSSHDMSVHACITWSHSSSSLLLVGNNIYIYTIDCI